MGGRRTGNPPARELVERGDGLRSALLARLRAAITTADGSDERHAELVAAEIERARGARCKSTGS